MDKTVWINGTERLIHKNKYGVYIAYLDEKDIKWLNKIHKNKPIVIHYAKIPKV